MPVVIQLAEFFHGFLLDLSDTFLRDIETPADSFQGFGRLPFEAESHSDDFFLSGVEIGQQVKVVFDALPELTLNGEVTHINTRYEEKRGDVTYTVTVAISQPDPAMRWGMTAAVQFVP